MLNSRSHKLETSAPAIDVKPHRRNFSNISPIGTRVIARAVCHTGHTGTWRMDCDTSQVNPWFVASEPVPGRDLRVVSYFEFDKLRCGYV